MFLSQLGKKDVSEEIIMGINLMVNSVRLQLTKTPIHPKTWIYTSTKQEKGKRKDSDEE